MKRKDEIIKAADLMILNDWSIKQIASYMRLPMSRVYRYLRYKLERFDVEKYTLVSECMLYHRYNRKLQKRCGKNTIDK